MSESFAHLVILLLSCKSSLCSLDTKPLEDMLQSIHYMIMAGGLSEMPFVRLRRFSLKDFFFPHFF